MRINIRGGREIAVSQPLLNHLHRDTVCQKQTGARVAQIVKADAPQMIILQDNLERIGVLQIKVNRFCRKSPKKYSADSRVKMRTANRTPSKNGGSQMA